MTRRIRLTIELRANTDYYSQLPRFKTQSGKNLRVSSKSVKYCSKRELEKKKAITKQIL